MASSLVSKNPFELLTKKQNKQGGKHATKKQTKPKSESTTKTSEDVKPVVTETPKHKEPVVEAPKPAQTKEGNWVETSKPTAAAPRREFPPRSFAPISERTPRRFENAQPEAYRPPVRSGEAPSGRRQFDRHSGTGRYDSESKVSQRWTGDLKKVAEEGDVAAKEARESRWERRPQRTEPEQEPETPVKTLEDYKKENEGKTPKEDLKRNLRKANAGINVVESKENLHLLLPKNTDPINLYKVRRSGASKSKPAQKKKANTKKTLEITPEVAKPETYKRSDDSRRPAETKTSAAAKPKKSANINFNNKEDFPTLG